MRIFQHVVEKIAPLSTPVKLISELTGFKDFVHPEPLHVQLLLVSEPLNNLIQPIGRWFRVGHHENVMNDGPQNPLDGSPSSGLVNEETADAEVDVQGSDLEIHDVPVDHASVRQADLSITW